MDLKIGKGSACEDTLQTGQWRVRYVWKIKAPIIYFFAMLLTNIILLFFQTGGWTIEPMVWLAILWNEQLTGSAIKSMVKFPYENSFNQEQGIVAPVNTQIGALDTVKLMLTIHCRHHRYLGCNPCELPI